MRKRFSILLCLILLVSARQVNGQQLDMNSSSSSIKIPATLSVLFNRVVVYHRDGSILSGLLVGIENNKLILRISGRDEKIPLSNLARVVIETEKKKTQYGVYGMFIGAYLGNIILFRAENQPTAYMGDIEEAALGIFIWEVIFTGAGGGLGYLAGFLFEKSKQVFNFTGSAEKMLTEWERLKRFIISGNLGPQKIHFSIQAGNVFTRISSRYKNILKNAGYDILSYSYMFEELVEEAIDFNLLRKLQLTISPTSNTEIGFAIYWLGEPSIRGDKWLHEFWSEVAQSLHTTGYYAIGIYKPFLKQMPKPIVWNVGLGVGAAKVDFNLKASSHSWYPYFEEKTEQSISKFLFSGIIFTELNLYPYKAMSLGLIADYAFIPSEQAPEIIEADIPAQKLRLGNGSIGFTLGIHF